MQDLIFIGILGVIVGVAVGLSFAGHVNSSLEGEQITEQQYRNQSLQYLEDIRNSTTQ